VTGPAGKGCGGVSVTAELLEEHVTGAVLDALESPRVQQAVRAGQDTSAPRSRAVPHRVIIGPLPAGRPDSPGGKPEDPAIGRDRDMAVLRQRAGSGRRG